MRPNQPRSIWRVITKWISANIFAHDGNVNMLILNRDAKVAYLCTKHLIVWVHKCANCVQTKKNMRERSVLFTDSKWSKKFSVDISQWIFHTFKERHTGHKAEAMSQTSHNRMAAQGIPSPGCKYHLIVHVFALNATIFCYQTVITDCDCGYLIQTAICLNQALTLQGAFGSCHLQLICWSCRRDAFKKAERRRGH